MTDMNETERIPTPHSHLDSGKHLSRRRFLKLGALLASGLILPPSVLAVPRPDEKNERYLKFYNTHTQERLEVCYRRDGRYDRDAVQAVHNILRDHRTNEVHPIDLRLLDFLHAIRIQAGRDCCLHIISGYRSPTTNAALRRKSRGVARKSLHMVGHAADIRIPGIRTSTVRQIALNLRRGGVGYYAKSDFVHVDIGRVRAW
jgi:uncharacterized protein YcbK (DUF882 family)